MSKLLDWLLKRIHLSTREALLDQLSLYLQSEFKEQYALYDTLEHGFRVYETYGQYFLNPDKLEAPKGWARIGNGWYGVAFSHASDPDVVYKVSLRPFDGYIRYAAWCLEHCKNADLIEGMPIVHEMRVTPRGTIVVLEKLDDLPRDAWGYRDESTAEEAQSNELANLIQRVQLEFPECSLDVHAGNIMIRESTGEYILTDPLSVDYESRRKLTEEGDDNAY